MRRKRVLERRDHSRIVPWRRRTTLHRRHVGVGRIRRVMHRHGPMVSWGHHGLPRGWWNRIRVTSRGRTAHGRDFGAKSEATVGGLGRVGRKLESGGDGVVTNVEVNALTGEDVVEVIEVKCGVVPLEERFALEELALDALGVATGCEGLTVTIFLVARGAGGCASGEAGMLGVALGRGRWGREGDEARMLAESGGETGVCRRCRPTGLALIFLLLHRAHASCERRRRRGSAGCGGSSPFWSTFLLFLDADCGPGGGGCCCCPWGRGRGC